MKIREFSIEDFAAVSQLWRRSRFEIRPGDSKEELRRKLERDSDLFLVAEEGSKIVGPSLGDGMVEGVGFTTSPSTWVPPKTHR